MERTLKESLFFSPLSFKYQHRIYRRGAKGPKVSAGQKELEIPLDTFKPKDQAGGVALFANLQFKGITLSTPVFLLKK